MTRPHGHEPPWLLLIHQIPPAPAYFRAKVGRRLQRLGAVAIKNSVYALPSTDQTQEDFQWVAREIVAEGGEATLCRAAFVEGLRDDQVQGLFNAAREVEYAQIAEEARRLAGTIPSKKARGAESPASLDTELARLRKRVGEIAAIDFFAAPARQGAEAAIQELETRLRHDSATPTQDNARPKAADFRGRTWVTRKNVHIDRLASAWLIRRFIDPKAAFKFVPGQGYRSKVREVTFDMYEADFTHEGDRCTLETLIHRFDLREPGLAPIAQIVHDIDIKDGKFARPEGPGVAALVAGIALAQRGDDDRLELGGRMLDALLELFRHTRAKR